MDYDMMFKIVVIGNSGVGKTNLISRFTRNEFRIESQSTIGVEFSNKLVAVQNSTVRCQIWDTAGQERFRSITAAFYRDCLGALLVFSITSRASFENISFWLSELKANSNEEAIIVLIGNKLDQDYARQVSSTEAAQFAEENGISYLETSALDSTNVEQAFVQLAHSIHRIYSHRLLNDCNRFTVKPLNTITLTPTQQQLPGLPGETSKSSCCYSQQRE